jgi:hypothetical protein
MITADANPAWWRLIPGLTVAGLGTGVANAALADLAVRSVPPYRVAMGSAANNAARYLGSSVGVALVAVLLALNDHDGSAVHSLGVGMRYASLVSGLLTLGGALFVALCREKAEPPSPRWRMRRSWLV